ncbi:putative long-chain specific acyl-CoA dehydrogenase, mitochondrial isoform X2 [Apostichopus japonicus]|uniref:Putative long-chain specific acyl-CoA dehydrogenase, mitochondrial isoform X2 n=1 Tax=Stichopus japonicus TaxID=307972 RepID=A0A2G8LKC2_STIJA|nr:putative long-chain specific acyl-CoA dehydrogenase, mitochondrial isoform X2 [Apostichopus japonicus]
MTSLASKFLLKNVQYLHQARLKTLSVIQVVHRSSKASLAAEIEEENLSKRPDIGQAESLLDIGTRDIFSEEHDIFREHVRRFFTNEILPNQERWERQKHVDRNLWRQMGSAGLLGVNIPDKKGGIGGDFKAAMIVTEEQGYANGAGSCFPMHSDIVMPYISEYGTQEQIDKFIPAMTAGEKIGALAMTEPGAGSDLQGIKTYAKKDGDDWILNGSKVFITNGYLAGVTIVVAITDLDTKKKAHGISLFLVEDGMPGFNKGKILEKIGQKSTDTAELFFDDVRLPASALLGGEAFVNKGFYQLMNQLPRERLLVAVAAQSHAEYAFEITRDYIRKRKAFGNSLSKLQTIQHKMAELKTEICISRSFVDKCIELQTEGILDSTMGSMSKYWSTDLVCKVANECLQLHGGWGYMWEYPIARAFADSRVLPIYAGSNEIMKELIARDIIAE